MGCILVLFIGLLLLDGEQRVAEVPSVVATAGGLQPPVGGI
ncbi:hypothetical protein NIES267_11350 [Calothrix parasitica NIES-267]|uniref:Uncharacterized protein n=1 Tax=Calothrix parasitica NIES-267 TaxID=1973488 RepID=A0A1Z4LKM5_9CYAN|nr:hypothetical protein NIES267_11350 [Calothrix parasitica NIES-267]